MPSDPPSVWGTMITSLVANAAAAAVAFGVPLSGGQQTAILAFVGSVTTVGSALVAWLHAHHTAQAVKLAAIKQTPAGG